MWRDSESKKCHFTPVDRDGEVQPHPQMSLLGTLCESDREMCGIRGWVSLILVLSLLWSSFFLLKDVTKGTQIVFPYTDETRRDVPITNLCFTRGTYSVAVVVEETILQRTCFFYLFTQRVVLRRGYCDCLFKPEPSLILLFSVWELYWKFWKIVGFGFLRKVDGQGSIVGRMFYPDSYDDPKFR